MSFGPATPFLIVSDLQRTIAYYSDTLGFELRHAAPDPDPFFAVMGKGQAQVMFKMVGDGVSATPNSSRHEFARWDMFIYAENPNEAGTSALTDDGLFGFEVTDPDGYVVFIGRPAVADEAAA